MADNKVKVSNNKAHYWSEQARGYSQQAGSYATAAGTSATLAGNYYTSTQAAATDAITSIGVATTNGVGSVNAKETESLSVIAATTSASTTAIEAVGTSVVSATTTALASATTNAVGSVNTAKTSALNTISGAKTEALTTIGDLKTSAVNTITTLTTEVTTTISALTTQCVTTINGAKTSALNSITALVTQTSGYANNSHVWAEGTDEQVQALGGTHSAKEWCLYNSTINQNDVRALEGGLNQGEVYTQGDSDSIDSRLSEIKSIAHSTFDLSKFTVVGSPNITDDGIVSGFSASNYLTPTYNFNNASTASSWEVCCKVTANNGVIFATSGSFYTVMRISSMHTLLSIGNGSSYAIQITGNTTLTESTEYYIKFKFTGNKYQILLSTDGINYIIDNEANSTGKFNSQGTWVIGRTLASTPLVFGGSIDLKQFSITVDGVPVFSGNKTGIDTIKPDNYTVVGTPTISADGVVSGFGSSGNYLRQGLSVVPINEVLVRGKFKYVPDSHVQVLFNAGLTRIGISSTYVTVNYYNNTSTTYNYSFSSGDIVEFEILIKSGTQTLSCKINGISRTPVNTSHELTLPEITYCLFGQYSTLGYGNSFTGSIDLNAFKIYVDGDLVYQPCLKIPYTESKTGSKIVDSIYRDRVNDMAEQFGFANYYTLSDTDFTLPQVELYGLIGQKTLKYSYENGINKVELFSNRDLTQQGSCTSGVEVTFMRPFADTNYILTVPYSAKSATAFTPTQTGDWKAEGKGWL